MTDAEVYINYPHIPEIALGVFWGWFLIKLFLKLNGGIKNVIYLLKKYFETEKMAIDALKEENDKQRNK